MTYRTPLVTNSRWLLAKKMTGTLACGYECSASQGHWCHYEDDDHPPPSQLVDDDDSDDDGDGDGDCEDNDHPLPG